MFVRSFKSTLLLTAGAVALAGTPAFADGDDHEEEHFDIAVWNNAGTLTTGGWDHDTESLEVANLRVFEAHFGEDPAFPFSIDEPGIGGVAADLGLTVGSTIQLNLASGAGVWNGSGFDSTSDVMTIDYGPTSVNSTAGGALDFLVTEDYDLHPIYSIADTAADGAYILEFTASIDGLGSTDSFWIVFNLGLDDELFEEAVEWTEANYAPAPGALALLGLAGLAGRRRRG